VTTEANRNAAIALESILEPCDALLGQRLRCVYENRVDDAIARLTLVFDTSAIELSADEDDDSLDVRLVPPESPAGAENISEVTSRATLMEPC
jgi:hypothetical protein